MDKNGQEYKKIKENYPEDVVLYQVGIFYQIMFEDARKVAGEIFLKR